MNKNMNKDILDYKINEIKTNLDIAFDTNQYYIDHNTIEIKKVNTVKLANLFDVEIEESDILPDFNDGILYVDNEYKKIETYKNTNVKNIEDEIKKTEEFLSELKKLKERIEK